MNSNLPFSVEFGTSWRGRGSIGQQAALTALLVSVGVAFNGLNSASGNPILFLLCGGALALALLIETPPTAFWRRA